MPKNKKVLLSVAVILCLAVYAGLIAGCTGVSETFQPIESSGVQEPAAMTPSGPASAAPSADSTAPPVPTQASIALPGTFPLEFSFSSGAGGWGTSLTLHQDGTFSGTYSDSDMGDAGDSYPQGTVRICEFTGRFGQIKQIDEHTYSMTLEKLSTEDETGKEWLENETRFIAADPYGLEDGDVFLFYTPQTPVEGLSEAFLSWWPGRYEQKKPSTLSRYAIYNQKLEYGFFTYDS